MAEEKGLVGHGYERANVCSQGEHQLHEGNFIYHTKLAEPPKYGAEPVCCGCAHSEAPCPVSRRAASATTMTGELDLSGDDEIIGQIKEAASKASKEIRADQDVVLAFRLVDLQRIGGLDWGATRAAVRRNPQVFAQVSAHYWRIKEADE